MKRMKERGKSSGREERERREFFCQLHMNCYHFPYMAVATRHSYMNNDSSVKIYEFD